MNPYRQLLPRWTFAVATVCVLVPLGTVAVHAQAAFPAPLPGQAAPPPGPSPFPPVNGATGTAMPPMQPMNAPAAFPSNGVAPMGQGFSGAAPAAPMQGGGGGGGGQAGDPNCMKEFMPLKQDAEKKAAFLQELGKRKNKTPAEACKGFTAYSQAEFKMIKFIEANSQRCGIPASVPQQMLGQHKNTEAMQTKVCTMAQQQAQGGGGGGPGVSLGEALGVSGDLPDAKPTKRNGGSTFDTLNGNVLAR